MLTHIFFKYISGQLLLEEHWISLKMTPVAVAMNVSNASYQKEFLLFSFFESPNGKFVEMSIKTFIKVFLVREFFCLLNFLTNVKKQLFKANCLSSFFKLSQMETLKSNLKKII